MSSFDALIEEQAKEAATRLAREGYLRWESSQTLEITRAGWDRVLEQLEMTVYMEYLPQDGFGTWMSAEALEASDGKAILHLSPDCDLLKPSQALEEQIGTTLTSSVPLVRALAVEAPDFPISSCHECGAFDVRMLHHIASITHNPYR